MPPTHQRFKDLKERRISLGPWLCKLSEPSELSALSVPGSLDCWLPGSLIDLWLPGSRTVWSQGGRKHSGFMILDPGPRTHKSFGFKNLGPRTQIPRTSDPSSQTQIQRIQAPGARNARDSSHRLFDPPPQAWTPGVDPRRGFFWDPPPCYKSFGFRNLRPRPRSQIQDPEPRTQNLDPRPGSRTQDSRYPGQS